MRVHNRVIKRIYVSTELAPEPRLYDMYEAVDIAGMSDDEVLALNVDLYGSYESAYRETVTASAFEGD